MWFDVTFYISNSWHHELFFNLFGFIYIVMHCITFYQLTISKWFQNATFSLYFPKILLLTPWTIFQFIWISLKRHWCTVSLFTSLPSVSGSRMPLLVSIFLKYCNAKHVVRTFCKILSMDYLAIIVEGNRFLSSVGNNHARICHLP